MLPNTNVKYGPLALGLGNKQNLKQSKKTIGKGLKEVGKIICGGRKFGNARTCGHVGNRKGI